jgi:N-sulfoglucosamine sulfohydrolase
VNKEIKMPPNILLITADDMNWDAVGAYGCHVDRTTPNIDQLAAEGIRFEYAHVNIAVCQPSRSAIMTGCYPHRNGGEGFFHLRRPGIPILPELLRNAGYQVGVLGKVGHSTPYTDFHWDMTYDMQELGMGRNPGIYHEYATAFIKESTSSGKPFFLMLNSHDPHRPFFGNDKPEWYIESENPPAVAPSRIFSPNDVKCPGFLADLPEVQLEISEYYSSVRRCDDTIGAALGALSETGMEENTLILFLSDNGMAFPFAKTNCYLNSTRTPWIMRWPGIIESGVVDSTHMVSGIDIMPTFLEAAGVDLPKGVDGSSFLQVLKGQRQPERDKVFTEFHQTAGKRNYPMRCVQTKEFGYIFNPWSNGERIFRNESQAGRTMKAMREAAKTSRRIAGRINLFLHRVSEELYDFQKDPDGLNNLVGVQSYSDELVRLRSELENWMERTEDPALKAFRNKEDRERLEDFMRETALELGGE